MTAILVRQLPLTLGGALGGASLRLLSWGFERFMRAPFTYLGIASLVGLSAAAGTNAMYWQTMRHPAPLWGAPSVPQADAAPPIRPIVLAPVRQTVPEPVPVTSPETTGSLGTPADTDDATGNARVFAVQKKLEALHLFDGKVDGYYGPQTARAIRAFEEARGLKPQGAMTSDVVEAILAAPMGNLSQIATEPAPVRQAMPVQQVAYAAPSPVVSLPPLTATSSAPAATDLQQTASISGGGTTVDALIAADTAELPALADADPQVQQASMGPAGTSGSEDAASTRADMVIKIQKGLASLGFLAGTIDGVASERTAKAIRNFEVFNNFPVSGQITPDLVTLLAEAGASF